MTDIFKAIILGVLEGLTEFIPVSSTGHLILAGEALNFQTANLETFSISIQLGAILAVVVLYWSFFKKFLKPAHWIGREMKLILVAITPALLFGFLLHDFIKNVLFSSITVVAALVIGGIIMIAVDKLKGHSDTLSIDTVSFKQAAIIGLAQCAALWPGMSRSGSTIVGGILSGLDYATAARFSFIISVPVMIAAVSYDLLKSAGALTTTDIQLIGVGLIVSFLVAILAIKWFMKVLVRFELAPFGIYRILIGLATFFYAL